MNDKTLKPDEQKVYDQLVKTCSKPLTKIPRSLRGTCVVLKKQLEDEAAQRKKDAENALYMQKLAADLRLASARLRASLFVIDTVTKRRAEAEMLLYGLILASEAYDTILSARARKPFLMEVILGVGLAFIPELKVFQKLANRYVPSVTSTLAIRGLSKAKTPSLEAWEKLADHLLENSKFVEHRVIHFAQALDDASTHVIHAVRDPMLASSEADEETKKRLAGHAAKNQVMASLLNAMARSVWVVAIFQSLVFRFIFWTESENVEDQVKSAFAVADLLEDLPYPPSTVDMFAKLVLYDMLRAYVRSYFRVAILDDVVGTPTYTPEHLPDQLQEHEVEGLDRLQMNMIFDQFRTVPWKDSSRPPVNNYKDLLKHWAGPDALEIEYTPGAAP
jgi:hypothetical protein